jgi:diacylglycerol kinase (ATP)
MSAAPQHLYVVFNPAAGNAGAADIHRLLRQCAATTGWSYEVYTTTGLESVAGLTCAACQQATDLVVAAGGDGTVAGVVNGLIGSGIPLGIIPLGTGNGLARALGIPLTPKEAIDLLTGDHLLMELDALQVGERYFLLNVSAGVSSRSMRATGQAQKRRFGILAYAWSLLRQMAGFEQRRFRLEIDGHTAEVRAAEIMVTNGAPVKAPLFPLGPRERFSDGVFEVYILTAHSLSDRLRTIWNLLFNRANRKTNLRLWRLRTRLKIETIGEPLEVQADGEVLGFTPVEVRVVQSALSVIVPREAEKKWRWRRSFNWQT